MDAAAFVKVLGGLGLFLLGIHHLTEGLKSLAGDSLRRALQTLVSGRFSAVVSGALFTVAIQSSSGSAPSCGWSPEAGCDRGARSSRVSDCSSWGSTTSRWA